MVVPHQMRHPLHNTAFICYVLTVEAVTVRCIQFANDLLFKLWIDILDNEYKVNRTRAINNIHTLHFTQIAVIKSRWREKMNDMRAKDWKWNSEFKWSDRVHPNSRTIAHCRCCRSIASLIQCKIKKKNHKKKWKMNFNYVKSHFLLLFKGNTYHIIFSFIFISIPLRTHSLFAIHFEMHC